jgi:hypothetical protein
MTHPREAEIRQLAADAISALNLVVENHPFDRDKVRAQLNLAEQYLERAQIALARPKP